MNAFLVSVALTLALWTVSMLYFRSYIRRRVNGVLIDLQQEVDKLVAVIDAATDRDVLVVEERIKAFRKIMEEADKRIVLFRGEMDKRLSERSYAELGRKSPRVAGAAENRAPIPPIAPLAAGQKTMEAAAPVSVSPSDDSVLKNQNRLMARDEPSGVQPAAEGDREPRPRFTVSATPIEPKPPSFAERVAELARAGFSSDLIAKRLGAAISEVELAAALSARNLDSDDTGH